MKKLSIIVSVMNGEKYIERCLYSLINQTYRNIEIIIIDDGSSDKTKEIIESYMKSDDRIVLISRENRGWGASINQGIEISTGDWIGICDSDDKLSLNFAEKMMNNTNDNIDVIKCGWYDVTNKINLKRRNFINAGVYELERLSEKEKLMILLFQPSVWSAIYRRNFLIENDIRALETPGASYQDTSFTFKVWINCKRFRSINENLYYYTVDNNESSVRDNKKIFCICDEYEEMDRVCPDRYKKILARLRFETYFWNYNRLDREGKDKFFKRMKEDFLTNLNYVSLEFFSPVERDAYLNILEEE